ncbi:LysE family translocator [Herbaspirillum robiniae]|uniref:LysE family transporter n=1 Tax=Herbaspirillum robiniae TaxID=2014887 RepID=A0ABX2LZW9_9BURK|nr:LysE family transporter [Herbaspirillum robiniae]NUU02710.1 LysE family transporter [Herbaspirillum robiniae]
MPDLTELMPIAGVLLLSVASPGPNFALASSTSMSVSRQAGMFTGLGFSLASGLWAWLAIAGVHVLINHAPAVHAAARVLGGIYLIWLGAKMLIGARRPLNDGATAQDAKTAVFRRAFLVSMTNPKAIVFYGSIFSVMVPANAPLWFNAAIVVLASSISACWYCGLALLFSHRLARDVYRRLKVLVETAMGVLLMGMGGRVLFGR